MRSTALLVLLSAVALLVPAAAQASTTVGPSPANPSPGTSQAINFALPIILFTAAGPSGAQLTAPADGVITSWQFYTDDVGEAVTAQLRTLAAAGPKMYALGGAGPVEPVAPVDAMGSTTHNVLYTFSSRLPISAGQFVGVEIAHKQGSFVEPVLPAEDGKGWEIGCIGPGCGGPEFPTDATPTPASQISDQWVAMNANVEPDVDHDGLGDETQDSCVGVCQPPTPKSETQTQTQTPKKKCKKGKKLKHGKCVKKHKKKHRHKPRR